ncbi:MAG TPA: lamin tail domain-containing protein [Myxococcota bacterium]|nr:lamin tail domain-containing protein [Myxococcota bacterium]
MLFSARRLGPALATTLVASAALAVAPTAAAHTIVVDGAATDWVMAQPTNLNTGHIGRNATGQGEYVWNDPTGDERTDFAPGAGMPDAAVDIDQVAITADAANLYVIVRMADVTTTSGSGAPMVELAIDTDGVAGSGTLFFRGLADTDVAADAAWEFLIQTRFGSGSASPSVWNAAGVDVAAGALEVISDTNNLIEIAVPWANLGGAPAVPLRFSVASFHGDGVDDAFDVPGLSDALDAVTNYGAPALGTPNTFTEVSDGVLDYHFEVWFNLDPDVEPSAPVLISEVFYDTPGTDADEEWVELFNVSGTAVSLGSWRVGDSEMVGDTEAMFAFPASATVGAGRTTVVASKTTATVTSGYSVLYGKNPNFEIVDTSPVVPNMTPDTGWSTGTLLALSNTADEVVLLDRFYTAVDVMTYATGVWPGVTSHGTVPTGSSLVRTPVRRDTNDCSVDFAALAAETPGTPALPCTAQDGVTFVSVGTACDDGAPCAEGETCGAAGACAGAAPVVCAADGNPCTQDTCLASFLGCYPPEMTGLACADACTTGGMCSSAGICTGGAPITCDDGNGCTDDACSPASGCAFTPNTGGCDDGDACTTGDACSAGSCVPGGPLACDDGSPCTADSCDAVSGCVFDGAALDGTPCDDGLFCTAATACAAGACAGGAPIACGDGNACTLDSCDEAGDACVHDAAAVNGAACDDGAFCTLGETCSAGTCGGGAPNACSDVEGCTADSCDEAADVCLHVPLADGTPCSAGGGCFIGGVCTAGACPAGTPAPSGTPCDDGDACSVMDACDGTGACLGSPADCDDFNPCTTDTCASGTGCAFAPLADGAACDDGDACTMGDRCIAVVCGGTPGPTCDGMDAGVAGTDAGTAGTDAGNAGTDAGAAGTDAAATDAGGTGSDAAASSDSGTPDTVRGGCHCRTAAPGASAPFPGVAALLGALALAVVRHRRRR